MMKKMISFQIDMKNIIKNSFENIPNIIWSMLSERACMKFWVPLIDLYIYASKHAIYEISDI
jgi:hypothetical protein